MTANVGSVKLETKLGSVSYPNGPPSMNGSVSRVLQHKPLSPPFPLKTASPPQTVRKISDDTNIAPRTSPALTSANQMKIRDDSTMAPRTSPSLSSTYQSSGRGGLVPRTVPTPNIRSAGSGQGLMSVVSTPGTRLDLSIESERVKQPSCSSQMWRPRSRSPDLPSKNDGTLRRQDSHISDGSVKAREIGLSSREHAVGRSQGSARIPSSSRYTTPWTQVKPLVVTPATTRARIQEALEAHVADRRQRVVAEGVVAQESNTKPRYSIGLTSGKVQDRASTWTQNESEIAGRAKSPLWRRTPSQDRDGARPHILPMSQSRAATGSEATQLQDMPPLMSRSAETRDSKFLSHSSSSRAAAGSESTTPQGVPPSIARSAETYASSETTGIPIVNDLHPQEQGVHHGQNYSCCATAELPVANPSQSGHPTWLGMEPEVQADPKPVCVFAVDVDEVCCQYLDGFRRFLQRERPQGPLDINTVFDEAHNPHSPWRLQFALSRGLDSLDAVPGAAEALNRFKEAGIRLEAVTTRPPIMRESTETLLNKLFPPGTFSAAHFVGPGQKGFACNAIGACALIDDQLPNCIDACACGVTCVLFDLCGTYIWSQNVAHLPVGCRRIQTWAEACDFLLAKFVAKPVKDELKQCIADDQDRKAKLRSVQVATGVMRMNSQPSQSERRTQNDMLQRSIPQTTSCLREHNGQQSQRCAQQYPQQRRSVSHSLEVPDALGGTNGRVLQHGRQHNQEQSLDAVHIHTTTDSSRLEEVNGNDFTPHVQHFYGKEKEVLPLTSCNGGNDFVHQHNKKDQKRKSLDGYGYPKGMPFPVADRPPSMEVAQVNHKENARNREEACVIA